MDGGLLGVATAMEGEAGLDFGDGPGLVCEDPSDKCWSAGREGLVSMAS